MFLHVKRNNLSKLKDMGSHYLSLNLIYLENVLVRVVVSMKKAWWIPLCVRLENCEESWNVQELSHQCPGQVSFFEYFVKHYSSIFENTMLKNICSDVGLGFLQIYLQQTQVRV